MPAGLREVVLSFKFRQNRLNGFRDVGGRNLSFPILKASGLYNSLYYRTSRDFTVFFDLIFLSPEFTYIHWFKLHRNLFIIIIIVGWRALQ